MHDGDTPLGDLQLARVDLIAVDENKDTAPADVLMRRAALAVAG